MQNTSWYDGMELRQIKVPKWSSPSQVLMPCGIKHLFNGQMDDQGR